MYKCQNPTRPSLQPLLRQRSPSNCQANVVIHGYFAGSPLSGLTNACKHNNPAREDNRCFCCGKLGHLMKDFRQRRRESESRGPTRPATAKQIQSSAEDHDQPARAELSDPPEGCHLFYFLSGDH